MTFEVINYFQRSGFALRAFLKLTRSIIWRPTKILHIECAHAAGTHVSTRGCDCDFFKVSWPGIPSTTGTITETGISHLA
jgi:hypothetical protein